MQAPFKEARVDEERPHKQGLAQQHDDHMVPSPSGCRLCGTGVAIATAVRSNAVRVVGTGWLWRRFCHHRAGTTSAGPPEHAHASGLDEEPPVYADLLPRDIARVPRNEEEDGAGHLLGATESPEGNLRKDLLSSRLGHGDHHVRLYKARRHGVDG